MMVVWVQARKIVKNLILTIIRIRNTLLISEGKLLALQLLPFKSEQQHYYTLYGTQPGYMC